MRSLFNNKRGNIDIIIMAVVAAIVIAVSLIIVYSVMGGLDTTSADENIQENVYGNSSASDGGTPAANASDNLLDNLGTFFTISPIYIVVLAAVGIIGAVMMIMVKRK